MTITDNSTFIWQVESLRLTLFLTIPEKKQLWVNITGTPPENRTERIPEGITIEDGLWEKDTLTVQYLPDRVNIIISPVPLPTPDLPNIGKIEDVLLKTEGMLDRLSLVGITRIAFGLVVLHPDDTHSSSYQSLSKLLPNVKIESDAREFLYQINLPTRLKSDDQIEINSLRRYSAIRMRIVKLSNIPNTNDIELFATRLELDINTSQGVPLDNSSNIDFLMKELMSEAVAITQGETHA